MSFKSRSLIVVVLLFALPPVASARTTIPATDPFGAPQLAGDAVIFGSTARANRSLEIRAARGNERSQVVRTFPGVPPASPQTDEDNPSGEYATARFSAAAGALAIDYERGSWNRYGSYPSQEVAEGGLLHGPWRPLACIPFSAPFADGNRIAYTCSRYPEQWIVVEDAASGVTLTRIDSPSDGSFQVSALDVAGDYILVDESGSNRRQFVVRSVADGREITRVPAADFGAIQADGKLAVVRNSPSPSGCAGLAWYAPGDPVARPIQGCDRAGLLRMSSDRVAFAAGSGQAHALVVVGLDGSRREIAGKIDGFDLDGNLVAYRCVGEDQIVVESVAETGSGCADRAGTVGTCAGRAGYVPPGESASCPLSVSSRRVRASRSSRVPLMVTCRLGCKGTLVLERVGRPVSASGDFKVGSVGTREKVVVPLRRGTRVPRRGLLVRAKVRWRDREGVTQTLERSIRVLPARR